MNPKIICTIGPSSYDADVISRFKDRGVNFLRINLSHTEKNEIEEKIKFLRNFGIPIILDTEGSQIRTGNTHEILLQEGQEIKIHNSEIACDKDKFFLNPLDSINFLKIGDLIFVDFNSVLLSVSDTSKRLSEGYISCRCIIGGAMGSKKGVHVDSENHLPAFSEKDIFAIELAKKYNINTFTLSFIRKTSDVLEFKSLYPGATIFSKIETEEAINNLNGILIESDGILIDRGDLSREIPIEKIPLTQKYVIFMARKLNKEAFVATNTLEKMSFSLKPDKSEANDIISTILDGATGIALTKETAAGKYPVETVNMLKSLFHQLALLKINPNNNQEILTQLINDNYFQKKEDFLPKPHGGKLINRVLRVPPSLEELSKMKKLLVEDEIIMDAEQIALGSFSPLEGFMGLRDLNSVLDNMRLTNNIVWTLPIILQVDEKEISKFNINDKILLVSKSDNQPYAILNLNEIYPLNKLDIAKKEFSTLDMAHPGVKNLFEKGDYALAGTIDLIQRKDSPYKLYELSPFQTRRIFIEKGWKNIIGFHTRNVIHRSHEFIQLEGMKKGSCDGLFIHPIIGKKKTGDFEADVIINSYEIMERNFYPKSKVLFSTFSTFSRYAGPREAIFTALVRKNFGCSHFIVGRDHTGVKDFYHPNASHEIFDRFTREELGIIPIKFDKVFYSDYEKTHIHEPDYPNYPEDKKLHISGTQVRDIFQKGDIPPEWVMRPEISKFIMERIKQGKQVFVPENNKKAKIIWFTGLSGSGKTSIANELVLRLNSKSKKIEVLDGDIVRNTLNKHLGFTSEDIKTNNKLIAQLCSEKENSCDFILVPIISPFEESRSNARKQFRERFIEVFVHCPLEECKKRDVKGLYKKVETGELKNFIGIHVPYEFPKNPDIILNTHKESLEESVEKLLGFLLKD